MGTADTVGNIALIIVLLIAPVVFLTIRSIRSLRCVKCGRFLRFSGDLADEGRKSKSEELQSVILSKGFFSTLRRTCVACRHLNPQESAEGKRGEDYTS